MRLSHRPIIMHLALLLLTAGAPSGWTVVLGGDVMLNGIKPGTKPLEGIARRLRQADIAMLNLEIPLTNAKTVTLRKSKDEVKKKLQFILKADPRHGAYLAQCGVDAVSLGTNHAMDFRAKGLAQMIATLDAAHILHAGAGMNRAEAVKPAILTAPDGKHVALLSFATFIGKKALWHISPATDHMAGVAVLQHFGVVDAAARAEIGAIVARARRSADRVFVALHGGVERTAIPTAYQVSLARAFVDAGADVVIGHHPHVLQGAEWYRGKPIFYSVGNLISPRPGSTALFHLRFDGSSLVRFAVTPCSIRNGKTRPLNGKAATAAVRSYNALCRKLEAKYPNAKAKPLTSPFRVGSPAAQRILK